LNNEKATKEAFTPDGFLRTGDIGYFGENQYPNTLLMEVNVVGICGLLIELKISSSIKDIKLLLQNSKTR